MNSSMEKVIKALTKQCLADMRAEDMKIYEEIIYRYLKKAYQEGDGNMWWQSQEDD